MVGDGPQIPRTPLPPKSMAPNISPKNDNALKSGSSPLILKRRGYFDPHNIEMAFIRLAKLLLSDVEGQPREDVNVRGFYINILV